MTRAAMRHHTNGPAPVGRTSGAARGLLVGSTAAVLAGLAGLWIALRRDPAPPVVPDPVAPARFESAPATMRHPVRFRDVTDEAGIRFRHESGARGQKLLPETMGGGCAFIDFDRDGDQDIFLVNSCPWPGAERADGPRPTQALYANDGKGRFEDVTAAVGLDLVFYGMGVAVGDVDRDGWDDLFVTAVGQDRLLRNVEGKRFEDVGSALGLPEEDPDSWSSSAAFLDYDADGWLDLFVCRYIEWSPEVDLAQEFQITGIGRAYGPPRNFAGTFCRLYRNHAGKLEDVSRAAGVEVRNPHTGTPLAKALGVAIHDLEPDGYPDICVANDTVQNLLFRNRRDGTFEETGLETGVAFDSAGNTRGAMGIDWAEIGEDGRQAFVVGNFAGEITALYVSELPSELPFTDNAIAEGIGNPSRRYMKFGVLFLDFDLDGRLDIFEANGHLEHEIGTVQPDQSHAQPCQLFWNAGPRSPRGYEAMSPQQVGDDLFRPAVGRGAATADIDGDGDLDILLAVNGGSPRLLRNDGGNKNGWIRFALEGRLSNRNAFGARVEIVAGGRIQRRTVRSGRGYLSQSEQMLTFGLADQSGVESARIWWPGEDDPQEIGPLAGRTLHRIRQP